MADHQNCVRNFINSLILYFVLIFGKSVNIQINKKKKKIIIKSE